MLPARLSTVEPELDAALRAYIEGVFTHPALPEGVLEQCRLRIAQLLGAVPGATQGAGTVGAGPAGAMVHACLAFAEQFVLDAQALDEVTVERVLDAVGEEGYAVLTVGVGLAEGLVRAQLAWGIPSPPVTRVVGA